ncbi:unnamed protein product [Candidula unifasciata]|uniref:Uncharacterized protein n=1 Tax=Candidula unifasciata TaxID=100452 RepID=A0A8S3YT01_9EUPU|nr:unnamed protein product [Candidula unifasciata]
MRKTMEQMDQYRTMTQANICWQNTDGISEHTIHLNIKQFSTGLAVDRYYKTYLVFFLTFTGCKLGWKVLEIRLVAELVCLHSGTTCHREPCIGHIQGKARQNKKHQHPQEP